jgi:hypothetical protein
MPPAVPLALTLAETEIDTLADTCTAVSAFDA